MLLLEKRVQILYQVSDRKIKVITNIVIISANKMKRPWVQVHEGLTFHDSLDCFAYYTFHHFLKHIFLGCFVMLNSSSCWQVVAVSYYSSLSWQALSKQHRSPWPAGGALIKPKPKLTFFSPRLYTLYIFKLWINLDWLSEVIRKWAPPFGVLKGSHALMPPPPRMAYGSSNYIISKPHLMRVTEVWSRWEAEF